MIQFDSKVEQSVFNKSGLQDITTKMPYLLVDNFPNLGLVTALRFLEWVSQNPNGVISLPTGKTPEYFIKYTQYLLQNWNHEKGIKLRREYGIEDMQKPDLSNLRFVQIDEFYPIEPEQHNSFYNYVMKYYIHGFGLKFENALLISAKDIPIVEGKTYREVFPDLSIDLTLRYREAINEQERLQKTSIFMIDDWCRKYEQSIRDMGGIGFFLGGLGPDGHIAFNTRGSNHFSSTRLTQTNFETQAVAAGDLGGIEVSRHRLVITIGLATITFNPNAVAIIFAAGEAKADIVKQSLENVPNTYYPATVLQKLPNSRFYITKGASVKLNDSIDKYYKEGVWTHQKTERAVIDLCVKIDKYAHKLELSDLQNDKYCSMIPDLNENTAQTVINSIKVKLEKGIQKDDNQVIYHTGPHHDDIMLGIMPYANRQVRSINNKIHFSILTSGFTAVTNKFVIEALEKTKKFIIDGYIQMIEYPDFFASGFKNKWDKDVYHYLSGIAMRNENEKLRGLSHRIVRALVEIYKLNNKSELIANINDIIQTLTSSYDGSKNPKDIQNLKGMIREFEEETVWAHYGVPVRDIHHLRLGFYKGDLFTEQPDKMRDMIPVLEEFRKYKPSVISLAMDPEGSGPDTHYKVLQTIAGAVKEWRKEADLSGLKILGYRNVWFRFHPAEADLIVPVSLNSLSILRESFQDCYLTQVAASFPSYEYDGKFSELTQSVWVNQLHQLQLLLGKDFFYQNPHPLIRATHGIIYLRAMSADEFILLAEELEKITEGVADVNAVIDEQ